MLIGRKERLRDRQEQVVRYGTSRKRLVFFVRLCVAIGVPILSSFRREGGTFRVSLAGSSAYEKYGNVP
jgi:hypothetical protein